eukprot:1511191-Rhodomonas_salina.1
MEWDGPVRAQMRSHSVPLWHKDRIECRLTPHWRKETHVVSGKQSIQIPGSVNDGTLRYLSRGSPRPNANSGHQQTYEGSPVHQQQGHSHAGDMCGPSLHIQQTTHSMEVRGPGHTPRPMGAATQTGMATHLWTPGGHVHSTPRTWWGGGIPTRGHSRQAHHRTGTETDRKPRWGAPGPHE